jgi:hypothetical protein
MLDLRRAARDDDSFRGRAHRSFALIVHSRSSFINKKLAGQERVARYTLLARYPNGGHNFALSGGVGQRRFAGAHPLNRISSGCHILGRMENATDKFPEER